MAKMTAELLTEISKVPDGKKKHHLVNLTENKLVKSHRSHLYLVKYKLQLDLMEIRKRRKDPKVKANEYQIITISE